MSDTPITDKACGWPVGHHGRIDSSDLKCSPDGPFVHSSFARELERENAALRAAFKSAVILRKHEDGLDRIQKYVQKGCLLSGEVLLLMNRTAFDAARKEAQP